MKNKKTNYIKLAGILLILAALELVFFVILAQHIYPNYSLSNNYISDLGVGPTAPIFNSAIILFGIIMISTSALIWKGKKHKYVSFMFFLSGIGGMGVGIFPETTGIYHLFFAGMVFAGIALNAIIFSKIFKGKLSYYSLLVGLLALFI
ncbi:MAG: DUF998 domain-containing protein, partial [Candidatus Micrarchaeota archaeon]|nr:DUF998 domain-containing protein [Candidatus Micrarchaeota archaeon]